MKKLKEYAKPLMLFVFGFLTAALVGMLVIPHLTTAEENDCKIDQSTLEDLYSVIFHRPLDKGASGYVGQDLDFVLGQLKQSEEQTKYKALYKAMKSLEEAQREPGELSEEDKQTYKDYIDQASSIVNEWSKTLPEQAAEDKVVGPEQARKAIQNAWENMNEIAKAAAEKGLLQAQRNIGKPSDLPTPSGVGVGIGQ